MLINLSRWQSVLLSSFPSLQGQSFISLHICSPFTVSCWDLTLPGVNYLKQKSCSMERDEILLPFSLLLVWSKAVLKREGKETKKAEFFFSFFFAHHPF